MNSSKKVFLISLVALSIISIYPLYMGIKVVIELLSVGYLDTISYPKYIIPFTPIALSLIISTLLIPTICKRLKKFTTLTITAIGSLVFLLFELLLERIVVVEGLNRLHISTWQLDLCISTPSLSGNQLMFRYGQLFKLHFYLMAFLIVISVLSVILSLYKMAKQGDFTHKKVYIAQLISVAIFIGMCVFACFTGFYRTGSISISPLSALLISLFFIVFGVTLGVYTGCIFHKKHHFFSTSLPVIVSVLGVCGMYLGQYFVMNGTLFRLGSGALFEPIFSLPFAIIDIFVAVIAAVLTYFILRLLSNQLSEKSA